MTRTTRQLALIAILILTGCRFYQQQKHAVAASLAHLAVDTLLRLESQTPLTQSSSRPAPATTETSSEITVTADRVAPESEPADDAEPSVDSAPLPEPAASFATCPLRAPVTPMAWAAPRKRTLAAVEAMQLARLELAERGPVVRFEVVTPCTKKVKLDAVTLERVRLAVAEAMAKGKRAEAKKERVFVIQSEDLSL